MPNQAAKIGLVVVLLTIDQLQLVELHVIQQPWAVISVAVRCLWGLQINNNSVNFAIHVQAKSNQRVKHWLQVIVIQVLFSYSAIPEFVAWWFGQIWLVHRFPTGQSAANPASYHRCDAVTCWSWEHPKTTARPPRGKAWSCRGSQALSKQVLNITLWWTYKKLWNITIFNGKIHYKWPFSIAMLVHQRVNMVEIRWHAWIILDQKNPLISFAWSFNLNFCKACGFVWKQGTHGYLKIHSLIIMFA